MHVSKRQVSPSLMHLLVPLGILASSSFSALQQESNSSPNQDEGWPGSGGLYRCNQATGTSRHWQEPSTCAEQRESPVARVWAGWYLKGFRNPKRVDTCVIGRTPKVTSSKNRNSWKESPGSKHEVRILAGRFPASMALEQVNGRKGLGSTAGWPSGG